MALLPRSSIPPNANVSMAKRLCKGPADISFSLSAIAWSKTQTACERVSARPVAVEAGHLPGFAEKAGIPAFEAFHSSVRERNGMLSGRYIIPQLKFDFRVELGRDLKDCSVLCAPNSTCGAAEER